MTGKDTEEFNEIMSVLCSAYEKEMTAERQALYFRMLADYPIDEVDRAAQVIVKSSKFFPQVADFVLVIEGSIDEKASQAWYHYLKALHSPGPYKTVDMGDRCIHAAIKDMDLWGMGIETNGYPDNKSQKEEDFLRLEFIRRYKYHKIHSHYESLPDCLVGITEFENKRKLALGEGTTWTPIQLAIAGSAEQEKKAITAKSVALTSGK